MARQSSVYGAITGLALVRLLRQRPAGADSLSATAS